MSRVWRRLRAIPELLGAYSVLQEDVRALLADPRVRQAVRRLREDPAVARAFPRLSAEWRALSQAVDRLR